MPTSMTAFRSAVLCLLAAALPPAVYAFDVQGHRGGRGLAPENTLAAFDRALGLGVSTLELDIAVTADDVPVVTHDAALNPAITRDAAGRWLPAGRGTPMRRLRLADLQAYDVGRLNPAERYGAEFPRQEGRDGERIPTLAALFAHVAQQAAAPGDSTAARTARTVQFNIEAKIDPRLPDETPAPEAFASLLLATIRQAGTLERVTIQSFDWRALAAVQKLAPGVPTAYLTSERTVADAAWTNGLKRADFDSVPAMVAAAGGRIWSPSIAGLSAEQVWEAHARGLKVLPWTVNQPADIERLLGWGVDGMIGDYPDLLMEAVKAKGLPVAPLPR